MAYQPLAAASTAELAGEPAASLSNAAPRVSAPTKRARRSLSDIIFPPQLSLPVIDPFAPYEAPRDSSESDASSFEGGERYQDLDSEDEKALMAEVGQAGETEHWVARAAHTMVRRQLQGGARGAHATAHSGGACCSRSSPRPSSRSWR